jgi:3-methyladenine DNA glycosylase AlkC
MEPFKNIYNKKSISEIANEIAIIDASFDSKNFIKDSTKNILNLEMKERVVQIAESLNTHLKYPYKKQLRILLKTLKNNNDQGVENFILWPYTYFIEKFGIEDFEPSMAGLYEITKRFTSEFGVRPFFSRYPNETYALFEKWVEDPNEHVRRWVSEGTRPNLPWGINVPHLNEKTGKSLRKNLKLLEKLKTDPSLYVRTSVANHMNDISWKDSDLVIKTLKKWNKIKTDEMAWISKRALRNLLKQGNSDALLLLGFDSKIKTSVKKLKLSKAKIKEGDSLELSFEIKNLSPITSSLMVDYNLYYSKANGKLSKKTFKLKSINLEPNEKSNVSKKVSFKKVTTRKHYPGEHYIEVQVNGVVKAKTSFQLL